MSKLYLSPHWINHLLRQISHEAVYQSLSWASQRIR